MAFKFQGKHVDDMNEAEVRVVAVELFARYQRVVIENRELKKKLNTPPEKEDDSDFMGGFGNIFKDFSKWGRR